MKKIINGKMYDTETAKMVGNYRNGLDYHDFGHVWEELYQKRTGEFFLHGDGGPMSKYSVTYGNETSGSEKIIPMTEAEAKAWMEKRATAEEYIAVWGEPEE